MPLIVVLLAACASEFGLEPDRIDAGAAGPHVELWVGDPVDLGEVQAGCEATGVVPVVNAGDEPTAIDLALISDEAALSIDRSGVALGPGEIVEVEVALVPPVDHPGGDVDGVVDLVPEGIIAPPMAVPVTATVLPWPVRVDTFGNGSAVDVDILLVVDTSASMGTGPQRLADGLGSLTERLTAWGSSWQIGVVTVDPRDGGRLRGPLVDASTPDPLRELTDQIVGQGDGSSEESGFQATRRALSPDRLGDEHAGLLRDGADLFVLFFSNEEDASDEPVGTFVAWLGNQVPTVARAGAIVGDDPLGCRLETEELTIAAVAGTRYLDAAQQSGGPFASICTLDLHPILDHLARMAAGAVDAYPLSERPYDLDDVRVYVDGEPRIRDVDWSYRVAHDDVVFAPHAVPGPGTVVTITYRTPIECDG